MKGRNVTRCAAVVVLSIFLFVWRAQAESISVSDYRQQLVTVVTKINALESQPEKAGEVEASIPDHVAVATSSGEVSVNYKSLKDDLAAFSRANAQQRPGLLAKIQKYVHALSAAAETYKRAGPDEAAAHGKLNQILSHHEFNRVKGPNAKEALLARIYRWLARLLSKLSFGGNSRFDWMQLFIYLLVGAAASLLLIWTIRKLRRPQEELPQREIIPFSPSARGWRTWLAEARALAQQQDWRNAIHLAYWAGISYLEQQGAWKPNRARTPREYLRLVGVRTTQYPAVAALTRKLELVWYGYGMADESDFHETLVQLEKLGCR
ncbi:MAG: DUF4129 domain-containing protein [Candidatus Angelobacter sp.]